MLAYLALHAGELVPAERLVTALWDDPPATARKMVRIYAARIRKALGTLSSAE